MLRQADRDLLTKTSKSTKLMLLTELKNEIKEILKIIKNLNLQFNRRRLDKISVNLPVILRVLRTSLKRIRTCSSIQTRQA